jgi:hypothetical protein
MRRSGKTTFFERVTATFDRLPIRVRLAGVSALLTFVILCGFAVAVGSLTVRRIRSDFNTQVANAAARLPSVLQITATLESIKIEPALSDFASDADHAALKVLTVDGKVVEQAPRNAPSFGQPQEAPTNINGYRVVTRQAVVFETARREAA